MKHEADYTVRRVCEDYVQSLRNDGNETAANDTAARFRRYVYDTPLAKVMLLKLRAHHVASWKNDRLKDAKGKAANERGARSTVKRDISSLRAALNKAHDDGLVASDIAWRKEFMSGKREKGKVGNRRDIYLSKAQRRKLVEKAAPEIKTFLEALCRLPLRPGALAALTVADFAPRLNTLAISFDKGHSRVVEVPADTAHFLNQCAKNKLPGAPLFDNAGVSFNKDSWKRPIKRAVKAAKLPLNTTAYSIRHSVITDMITSGVDPLTAARLAGTSVEMISATYGHLNPQQGREALAKLY